MYRLSNGIKQKYAAFDESFFQSGQDTSRVYQPIYKHHAISLIQTF